MKNNTKKYVKLSLILYIVILSVALIGTLAWFVFQQDAEIATGNDSKIVAGEYLEICLNNGEDAWGSKLEFNGGVQYPDVSMTPSGDVWYPTTLNEDDTLSDDPKDFELVNDKDGYFVKLDLKVRATKGLDVYLHQDSFVSGVDMLKTDAANSFSKDAIAGAARVAFFSAEDGANTLKTVWVPNENYELSFDADNNPSFSMSGTPDSSYGYLDIKDGLVDTTGTWKDEQLSIGNGELASGTVQNGFSINNATPLLSFGEEGVKNLVIYIWIEGTDDESHTLLSGGSVEYNLKLVGIDSKAENTVNIDDVSYDNGKLIYTSTGEEVSSTIQYSYDEKTWVTYAPNDPHLTTLDSDLYVRARETATEKAGSVKSIQAT